MSQNQVIKSKLLDLLKKAHLNKTLEMLKLVVVDNVAHCNFITSDKRNIGYLKMKNIGMEDCEIGFFNLSTFLPLVDFLSEELTFQFEYNKDGVINQLIISDGVNTINYTSCDPSILEETIPPDLDEEPEYEIIINVDEEFIGNYLKAISALPDSKKFCLISDGEKTEVLMNYNNIKSNTAKFVVDVLEGEGVELEEGKLVIPTDFIQKILVNSRNTPGTILSASTEGLIKVQITKSDFEGTYFEMLDN